MIEPNRWENWAAVLAVLIICADILACGLELVR